jgi:hypothetical protein
MQAQLVLLKKLGIAVADNALESDVEKKIQIAFRGDMSSRKREVSRSSSMAALTSPAWTSTSWGWRTQRFECHGELEAVAQLVSQ